MPMGTDDNDTGHGPRAPQGGSALSDAEIRAKRAELQRQLAQLPPDTDSESSPRESVEPASAANPTATAAGQVAAPAAVIQNPIERSPSAGPADQTSYYYAPDVPGPQSEEERRANDPNENDDAPFSHWLHLADGRVRKALGTVTHWHENDDPATLGVPVVAAVANPHYQPGSGDLAARKRALLAELKALGLDLSAIGM